ncbi:MAG: N-acetylmuramoyl-L-alanine amidase [Candidatus Andersenbacteria bacterium]
MESAPTSRRIVLALAGICITIAGISILSARYLLQASDNTSSYTTDEVGFEFIEGALPEMGVGLNGKYLPSELENWQRPAGTTRVGIQAGHWKNDEVPQELEGLTRNGGGAIGGGTNERAVVLNIAEQVVALLQAQGIEADLLPTTVPPGYIADAFVSIHADGNLNSSVSGFKIAGPRRDYSQKSPTLEKQLYATYEKATQLPQDPSISHRMRGYYAFNWRRYEHAIHPMTPAVIVETGFLTSPADRQIIVATPQRAAQGISEGIQAFLQGEGLL